MSDDARSPWLTVREAAEYLRCSEKSVYRAINSRRNPLKCARLLSRDLRFRREFLDEYLQARITPAAEVRRERG